MRALKVVSPAYDYMVAIIVVGAIFVGCVIVVPHVNLRNLLAVDQQQLRNTALNTLNAILLDTGHPTDWGSEVNETFYFQPGIVERFGLANAKHSTLYVLDQDKVQRLDTNNPLGFLNYDQLRALLNLQNHGFHFRIIPPFNVTNLDGTKIDENHDPINKEALETGVLEYGVKVSYSDGRPIHNATILATVIFTSIALGSDTGTKPLGSAWTNISGTCRQNCTLVIPPDELTSVIVTLRVSVAEIATIVVAFGENPQTIVDINMAGDTVVLTEPKGNPNAAIEIRAIYVQGSQGTPWLLYKGQGPPEDKFNTGNGQQSLWNRTFSGLSGYDPILLLLHINKNGQEIVVAGPHRNLSGYSACEYGRPVESATEAVKLQRNVIIAGTTYTVELWLWKESS
jgi:hypothetical protein